MRHYMNYDPILRDIKPSKSEKAHVKQLSQKIIRLLDHLSLKNNVSAKAILVGSVAKGTWLSGKADIDIFLKFPLETTLEELKKKRLTIRA